MTQRIISLKILILLSFLQACLPDHLADLDQKTVEATFTKVGRSEARLEDATGSLVLTQSGPVSVVFGVNWLEDSTFTIKQGSHQAVFRLPESRMDREGKSLIVPAGESGQSLDIRFVETRTVSKETRTKYRTHRPHKSSRRYYRDTIARVTYGLVVDLFEQGAVSRNLPRSAWLGRITLTVRVRDERIDSVRIPRSEYPTNHPEPAERIK